MFICSDFNINVMKYETHNGTKRFLDCMYGLGLHLLGAIQVLRNADGGGGCLIFWKKALRRCNVQCY